MSVPKIWSQIPTWWAQKTYAEKIDDIISRHRFNVWSMQVLASLRQELINAFNDHQHEENVHLFMPAVITKDGIRATILLIQDNGQDWPEHQGDTL